MDNQALDIHLETEEGELYEEDQMVRGVDPSGHQTNNNNAGPEHGTLDPGAQALGAFIDETQTPDSEDQSQEAENDQFLAELAEQAFDTQGPAVAPAVAKLVQNHLSRDFTSKIGNKSHEDSSQPGMVLSKFKNVPVPVNLTGLRSCRVNDGVFKAMTPGSKKANAELHMVESAWCKSLIAQSSALEKLAAIKDKCSKDMRGSFNAVFGLLADSIEYSCFGRARTNEVRRNNILSALNDNYKHLSSETAPENGLLFGSDLEGAMKSVETTNRLSKKLANNNQGRKRGGYRGPFLGQSSRGRGRNRFGPYQFNPRYPGPGSYGQQQQGYHQNYHYQSSQQGESNQLPPPPPLTKSNRG